MTGAPPAPLPAAGALVAEALVASGAVAAAGAVVAPAAGAVVAAAVVGAACGAAGAGVDAGAGAQAVTSKPTTNSALMVLKSNDLVFIRPLHLVSENVTTPLYDRNRGKRFMLSGQ